MKKQTLLALAVSAMLLCGHAGVNAADPVSEATGANQPKTLEACPPLKKIEVPANKIGCKCAPECKCPKGECKCPKGECKCNKGPNGAEFKKGPGHKPSPEVMQAKKAEFEKRLGLTDAQKKKIEENRIKDREKMKPVMEKMKANRDEFIKVKNDSSLSDAEKQKKTEKLKKERKELQAKADKYHQENAKKFEAILTKEQKAEFEKIKAEKKAEFEKFKQNAQENKKQGFDRKKPHHPHPEKPVNNEDKQK